MLDNRHALLFVRGEQPIMDEKFDILCHPNVALTADGSASLYRHGIADKVAATIGVTMQATAQNDDVAEPVQTSFVLESEDEVLENIEAFKQESVVAN